MFVAYRHSNAHVATVALFIDQQLEGFASLVRGVVLLSEAMERAEIVTANAHGDGVGRRARDPSFTTVRTDRGSAVSPMRSKTIAPTPTTRSVKLRATGPFAAKAKIALPPAMTSTDPSSAATI